MKLKIPRGIKVISWTTCIRWFGWGFVEALIPVLLYKFSSSFLAAGLLDAFYWVSFLLFLPLIGALADRKSAKVLIVTGLLIYPFVGLGYFLAGLGSVVFILIARFLNGIAYGLDTVGRNTYIRRHAPKKIISSVFGYFTRTANIGWLIALLSSIFFVRYIPIHVMFLAISIAAILGLILIYFKLPREKESKTKTEFLKTYKEFIPQIKKWNKGLKYIAFLVLFLGFLDIVAMFFLPIYVYTEHGSLQKVILITAAMTIPSLFAGQLGKLADYLKAKAIFIGMILLIPLVALLGLVSYEIQLVVAFLMVLTIELINLSIEGVITRLAKPTHYGRVEGAMQIVGNIGSMIGPVAFGLLIDIVGQRNSFLWFALVTVIVSTIIIKGNKHLKVR